MALADTVTMTQLVVVGNGMAGVACVEHILKHAQCPGENKRPSRLFYSVALNSFTPSREPSPLYAEGSLGADR